MLLVKVHYLFVAPLLLLGIPANPFLGDTALVVTVVALIGLAGAFFGEKRLVLVASSTLLIILVSGKVGSDLLRVGSPDTAILLIEFGMILYLMEALLVLSDFERSRIELEGKLDEMSLGLEAHLGVWLRNLLSRQGRIAIGSIGLSVLLLPIAGFTSISIGQLPVTAALVLIAIAALLFLLTHRREPERRSHG